MKAIIAVLLLAVCPTALAAGATETVTMTGGRLVAEQAQPFPATRNHVTVRGLPANWSVGAGACYTASVGQYPKLTFDFHNGNETLTKLSAAGYTLSTGAYGLPATMVSICRDASGNVASATVQIVALHGENDATEMYAVTTTNTSATQGSSYASLSIFSDNHTTSIGANSSALNVIDISH